MDLHTVETYLRPAELAELALWQPGWSWLAGGTWIFTEPQPQIRTLVDMQHLGWSELEVTSTGLTLGATCIMGELLRFSYPAEWTAVQALQSAVHELASFKVQNIATIAGNLCLALPASTFAPVMVLIDAQYELLALDGSSRWVPALEFQTAARQTLLQPGEVLRKIHIPAASLKWRVSYQRICVATAGIAVAIVVAAYNPQTSQVRFGIGAGVPSPRLIELAKVPAPEELEAILLAQVPLETFLNDEMASAVYRRHVTQVLMARSLRELTSSHPVSESPGQR